MILRARCHCGNLALSLGWDPDPVEIPARACTCSFCVKHSAVWTSNPNGRLAIAISDDSLVSRYQQGTRTADFLVCARCGVVPVATSRIDERLYAVVNVNAFDGVDPALLRRAPAHLQMEEKESRLARRKRNWISNVRWVERLD